MSDDPETSGAVFALGVHPDGNDLLRLHAQLDVSVRKVLVGIELPGYPVLGRERIVGHLLDEADDPSDVRSGRRDLLTLLSRSDDPTSDLLELFAGQGLGHFFFPFPLGLGAGLGVVRAWLDLVGVIVNRLDGCLAFAAAASRAAERS
jgi:hypothetical protein